LGHAAQAARYNIIQGVGPPASGHWINNPHADDPDFVKSADLIGLMTPGMPRTAAQIADHIGHITSSGEGYYGGLYIANLYSLAFTNNKTDILVREALKVIPVKSEFYQCLNEVIVRHAASPKDWQKTWRQIQKKWLKKAGCPEGESPSFQHDARLYAAFVTLGLLSGNAELEKTFKLMGTFKNSSAVLSTTAGILGVMQGYQKLPETWKQEIDSIGEVKFKYSTLTFNEICNISYQQALRLVVKNGGKIKNDELLIRKQKPSPVKMERSFEGHYAREIQTFNNQVIYKNFEFEFEGIGFVLRGSSAAADCSSEKIIHAELYLNNKFVETIAFPVNFRNRRSDLFWKYQLPYKRYSARIKVLNPSPEFPITATDLIVYNVRVH
jgi:hypothetical protein